jgi:hypothetical protein
MRVIVPVAALILCSGFATLERFLAPGAELWERWAAHDPAATATIDHEAWNGFLARHLVAAPDGSTGLRYAAVGADDRAVLDGYIKVLSATAISRHARAEQLAYWINLYNALTVRVVLEHYPVASIKDIKLSSGFLASGPWDAKLITIEGEEISLNDIEHRIIRPIWRDPRVHYALNCASIGCPNLAGEAYTAASLDDRLNRAAAAFINSPRGIRINGGQVTASRIYDWFYGDFGGTDDAVFRHILRFASPELRAALAPIGKITDVAYDWRLNDAS